MGPIRHLFPILLLFAPPLVAETLSLGLKTGGRLTDDLESNAGPSESGRLAIGPMAAIRLTRGLAVEVDALYRRVGYSSTIPGPGPRDRAYTAANGSSWESPILLRKTLGEFYAAAGYAPRVVHGSGQVTIVRASGPEPPEVARSVIPSPWKTTHGVVSAFGCEIPIRRLRVAPEVRYTWWTGRAVNDSSSPGYSIVSIRHQLDILVGVTWTTR